VLRFASWWAIAVIVIFSIPKSKLAHYLAPAFPPMAVLVGAWLDEWLERRPVSHGGAVFAFAALGIGAVICGTAAFLAAAPPSWLEARIEQQFGTWRPGLSPAVMLGALTAGALVAAVAARSRRGAVVPALSGAMLVAGLGLVGWLNPRKSEIQAQPRKELAQFAAASTSPSVSVGVYYAKRNSTIFYLGRPLVDLGERRDEFSGLLRFLSSPTQAVAITHARFVPEIERVLRDDRDLIGEPSPKPCYVWERRGDYVLIGNEPPPNGG
jgi:4-amino-4-deoxy-L-arabinose transferase-like glycosyltransferase